VYCVGKLQLRCVLQVMAYLHERGMKGFVTLNVLLFDEELQRAEETIRIIAAGGADAVIVQVSSASVVRCAPCATRLVSSSHCH
jgi:collagenase-like PrtC family protease